jgi:Flp pilus assembly pilin Flp
LLGLSIAWAAALGNRVRGRQEGQAIVEYALLLFLIAVVSVVILGLLGTRVSSIFNTVVQDI